MILILLLPFIGEISFARGQGAAPVILDTDIGSGIDDAFALGLVLASPELDLKAVTTSGEDAETRAWMVCRFLTAVGKREVPVAWGRNPQPARKIDWQIQYRRHPAVIFNRTARPQKMSAVELIYQNLKAEQGKVTLVCNGPLTNVARLLEAHPECKPWIKRIVVSGGAIREKGRSIQPNLRMEVAAARQVFSSGVPLVFVPGSVASELRLPRSLRQRIFAACTPLTYQVQALYQLWDQETPIVADALAVALASDDRVCKIRPALLHVRKNGSLDEDKGKANAATVYSVQTEDFLKWMAKRLASGKSVLPRPSPNLSKLIPNEGFPNRVHVFEDYETDIEKRWWMSGKLETKNVPPASKRACRGVLTMDFDGKMGDTKTMYTAVIFNPVPGPPMGKNPRLRFRYWLKGTDTLRVQIYSLSKGYHRCLTLKGLPQEQWQQATVDMTHVRRPDGGGGPLSENERIDDIQFYVDPRAELIIDDIILYDAPVAGEKRPFPMRLQFTGWFDTGKQGKEWPGNFTFDKKGYFWRAARSVPHKRSKQNEIRVHLRGLRGLGSKTHLSFRYHLLGADRLRVALLNHTLKKKHFIELKNARMGQWVDATLDFSTQAQGADGRVLLPRSGDEVDEIVFTVLQGSTLLLDDLLLYTPQ